MAFRSKDWLASLSGDVLWYSLQRLASGLVLLVVFALLSRGRGDEEVETLYRYLFLIGFFVAALRALSTIAAMLQVGESRGQRLKRVYAAYATVLTYALLSLPLIALLMLKSGAPVWICMLSVAAIPVLGIDIDVYRAAMGKSTLVSGITALGGALSLALLLVYPSSDGAFTAVLLQWIPMFVVSALLVWRLRRSLWQRSSGVMRSPASHWFPLFLVATFDGVILNAPFLVDAGASASVMADIGVVTRIFGASLLFAPLVTFWSNGPKLQKLAASLHMQQPLCHFLLILGSSWLGAALYGVAFTLISGRAIGFEVLLPTWVLLASYAAFSAASRYGKTLAGISALSLLAVGGASVLGVFVILKSWDSALAVAIVQSTALLLSAAPALLVIARPGRSQGSTR